MAYPKKRQGFRLIKVDNQQFRWRYSAVYWQQSKALGQDDLLTIQGVASGGQQMVVTLKEPLASITPIFLSRAIHFGLSVGWEPGAASQPLKIAYQGNFVTI